MAKKTTRKKVEERQVEVKLLEGRAGTGFSQRPGQVITVGKAEAERLIAAGQAEPVKDVHRAVTSGGVTR